MKCINSMCLYVNRFGNVQYFLWRVLTSDVAIRVREVRSLRFDNSRGVDLPKFQGRPFERSQLYIGDGSRPAFRISPSRDERCT